MDSVKALEIFCRLFLRDIRPSESQQKLDLRTSNEDPGQSLQFLSKIPANCMYSIYKQNGNQLQKTV